jgi:excisionase family DNA binding protein
MAVNRKQPSELVDCAQTWTIDDVARFLRIPKKSIYLMCQAGDIPCAKFGKHWRFCREIVERWFREKMHCGEPASNGGRKPRAARRKVSR